MQEDNNLNKADLITYLLIFAKEKLIQAQQNFDLAKESVHSEDKSSAGDKHETSRAMAQIEWGKAANLVLEQQKLIDSLCRLEKITAIHRQVSLGSLVFTDGGYFFLSVGLGLINYNDQTVYVIGTNAPLGLELLGKKTGDLFAFNGKKLKIISLY